MERIKGWLTPSQKEGLINIVEGEIELTEEHFGSYKVPTLELVIGTESIKVVPVGRFIIGASGRVHIHSLFNRYSVLHHSEKGWIYRNKRLKGSFQSLTEDDFTKMLKDLV
ncbi:MAG: hypothetical protein ABF649_08905 [Bacillus sp. (in: firmicutes)]